MKKIFFFLILFTQNFYSQSLEVLELKDSLEFSEEKLFVYLEEKTDITKAKYIAKLKSTGSTQKPSYLFEDIKYEAQRLGANSFKFVDFKKTSSELCELTLDVFVSTDSIFDSNFDNLPKNIIYVFGEENLNENSSKTISYKVNGNKSEINSGEFDKFIVEIGKETKVNKGGFTGMTLFISGKENKPSTFLSFSNFALTGAQANPTYTGMGISINTGTIERVEPNFGLLLLKIFNQKK